MTVTVPVAYIEWMRIGLLHYSAPPVVGGVETILGKHALLMADAGHQVSVIAGRGAPLDPRIAFHQIPLVDSVQANVLSVKSELDQGVVSAKFDSLVSEIASSLDPLLNELDVLIAHNVCSLHKNLALTAALRRRTEQFQRPALILWHHDLAWTASRYRQELHDGYPWNLIRLYWSHAIPVVVSEFRRGELAALMGIEMDRIRVIPNGIAVTQLLGLNTQTVDLANRLELLSASPLILLPVRITRRKNIELALRIVAEMRKQFPRVMLVITGPPGPHNVTNRDYFVMLLSLREQLSVSRCVHFLADVVNDYLPEDVIYGLLRLSDLLLLPSFEEGFGLPVIEASQAKLPVFCSDIPPLRELGGDGAHYFSPNADPVDIASRISAYADASSMIQLRTRLRKYDWSFLYNERIEPLLSEAGKYP